MPKLNTALSDQVNQRLDSIGPSGIRAFDQKVTGIPGLVKLTLGEPGFNTPEHVKEAAVESIRNNDSHYSAQKGTPALRNAISGFLKTRYNLDYDPKAEIVTTIGATEALAASLMAMLNPGDKVIVPTPAFALYVPLITVAGGTPVEVDTSKDNFVLTPQRLKGTLAKEGDAVKAVILTYPNNPTGVEYTEAELQGLADVIATKPIFVIADEIYSELTYDITHHSIAAMIPEQTILVNGLSKSHAMTGYRIGYIAAPADFVKNAAKMHAFLVTAPSNPAQAAATEALTNGLDDPKKMCVQYKKSRDYVIDCLDKLGFETVPPKGAFYIFAKIPAGFTQNSVDFATELAQDGKVGVIPGSAFGPGGEGYIRLSYAASVEDLHAAMTNMKGFMAAKTASASK
ncbi:Aspartate aminotransferase [Pediococcus damnosus]|uniref:aminotransferase class I/II-fold pyridoxal phosphate-dependent enzyme n=1 Tax=Pediococcus damnosus TaxID=51663 RepID=UPI00078E6E35|nr:aminotransferase class I/II-fold pyridoxal phosphate-dependent enzyme [Pediococcus damnosus]AMV69955.1 Aspartate aminotransferase [Pediococcus damnosus]